MFRPALRGTVPEIEQREAARFALLRWRDYQRLPIAERASTVAHYRLDRLIRMHEHDAVNEHEQRRARAQQAARRRRRMG